MFKQIRWRLTATYLVVIFASMTVLGAILSYSVERQFISEVQSAVSAHANLCRSQIAEHLESNPKPDELDDLCRLFGSKVGARVVITTASGMVLGDSDSDSGKSGAQSDMPRSMKELRERFGCRICHSEVDNNQVYTVNLPIVRHGLTAGRVTFTASLYNAMQAAGKIRRIILVALVITGLIAALISMHLASTIADPIRHMNTMALKMSGGDLNQRVRVGLKDEVGQLADSLNVMAARLHDNIHQLAQEKDKMETILTSMADAIIVTDKSGVISLFSEAAERLTGLSSDRVIGQQIEELAFIPEVPEMIRLALNGENPTHREFNTILPAERIVHIYAASVHDENGTIAGSLAVLHDVTEVRRQAEFRKDFIANASHELRTPVASIRAIVGALQAGALEDPSAGARFVKNLDLETERLSYLLNDLLNLSELESGRLSPKRSTVLVRDIVARSVADLSEKAKQYGVSVTIEVPTELCIYADSRQVMQVMLNLVDNAIKYTGKGGSVTITGEETPSDIRIAVKDTGTGIPPADIDRIFERFYRVDRARSRQLGGTGLGLSIVKDIMQAHGGHVAVESTVGSGSTFTIAFRRVKSNA